MAPAITLSVYAHLFDRERSAEKAKAALEASFSVVTEQAEREPVGEVVPLTAVAG